MAKKKRKRVHPLVAALTLAPLATSFIPAVVKPATPARPSVVAAAHHGKKTACALDLAACPAAGCEDPKSPHGLLNQMKRRLPSDVTPKALKWSDFAALQQDADSTVGEDVELDASDRARLRNLIVSNGRVSEGDLVELTGFLVGKPHPNTGESVNCNLSGSANNDFHIPFAETADQTPFEGIVVEMIPQGRPAEWNIRVLDRAEKDGRMVRVTGQLLYDNMHRVNPDQDNSLSGQPPRFSLFEIHPVTRFEVCKSTDENDCGNDQTNWETLEEFAKTPKG
jgi:hypothetical protein